jgi:hypothetical protein
MWAEYHSLSTLSQLTEPTNTQRNLYR